MQVVDKVWGREVILANCDDYCGKLLELKGGYSSSTHQHKMKKETFYCVKGKVKVSIEDKTIWLDETSDPITILPKQKHSFLSKLPAVIMEVSTKHEDGDVYRYRKSYKVDAYCFDIDGTICTQEPDNSAPYNDAKPYPEIIEKINKLYDQGHRIIFFTARGSTTGIDWREFTTRQLWDWGVNYDELIFGKPEAARYIDDKAINVREWNGD